MPHLPPALHDLAACSNESAGIAAGIATLIVWGALVVAVTLAIATVSGLIVGARKGRVGHQVLVHLLWAAGFLVVLPLAITAAMTAIGVYEGVRIARDSAEYDAWLAPLRRPAAGEFDQAIGSVMNAKDADTRARRVYLIAALPSELEKLDVALNERERAALVAAARQLRTENVERKLGSDPSNLERLDGAVAWFGARPNLVAAIDACGERRSCTQQVLEAAERWCWYRGEACLAAMTPERIAAASARFHRESDDFRRIRHLPARAKEAIERRPKDK
jgi:hypothetical protein